MSPTRIPLSAAPAAGNPGPTGPATPAVPAFPDDVTLVLPVRGMTCASCVGSVGEALAAVPGVRAANVNLATEEATVVVAKATTVDALRKAVQDAGYEALAPVTDDAPDAGASVDEARRREERALTTTLAWSAPLALAVFVLAMGPMVHGGPSLDVVQLLLALPVQFVAGARFYRGAWAALRRGTTDMNTLVAIGTSAAFAASAWAVLRAGAGGHGAMGHTWFDTSTTIIVLILLGKWLEARAKVKTGDALRALLAFRPAKARVERGGQVLEIAAAEVVAGDVFVLRPGDRVPVDGIVLSGMSAVDESWLTGESLPIAKGEGDALLGGSANVDGALRARALRVGRETALARVIRHVREAQGSRAPAQALADRVAAVFVPIVLAIAAVTLVAWLVFDPAHALERTVAVLIIACPCALGLATPTAIAVAMGRGARAGLLLKNGEALERAGTVDAVVFDKTGTLTRGRPDVVAFELLPEAAEAFELDADGALALAAGAEAASEHPYAKAIVRHAQANSIAVPSATAFRAVPGRGVRADVAGATVRLGSPSFLAEEGVDLAPAAVRIDALAADGNAVLGLARGRALVALVALADTVKDDAPAVVTRLAKRGVEVSLLTGDAEGPARAVARATGIRNVESGVRPEEKAARVAAIAAAGRKVAMVGDGVNDAPALAAADLGIALGTGADVALDAADVTILRGDLAGVERALVLARRTRATIRQNLFWAFVYNALGIPLAAGAFVPVFGIALHPMAAAAAMALSSVSVLANSLRLSRTRLDFTGDSA